MKKKNIMILMISLSLVLLLGSSYALLRSTVVGNNAYVINVGNLRVEFLDNQTEELTLSNQMPISDKEGLNQTQELAFVISNTGSVAAKYNVYIEETSTQVEFKNVIKYIVNKNKKGYYEIKTLGKDKYIDKENYIDVKESIEYHIKLWLDYNADNTYMNKEFKAKVIIENLQADKQDTSGANSPKLVSNLIPVYYDEGEKVFKKADSKNLDSKYKWYDYENNMEAEVVKIKNTNSYIIDSENKTFVKGENPDMYFNGVDSYYSLGYQNYDFQNSISIVTRIKVNSFPNSNGYIIGNAEDAGFIFQVTSSKKVGFLINTDTDENYNGIYSSKLIDEGKWYTIIATYDNTNIKLYIYQDGTLISKDATSLSGKVKVSPVPILLGANPGGSGLPFDSFLNYTFNSILIYTDTLTDFEIENNFTGEITSYPEDNLLISNKDIHSKEGHYTIVNNREIYFDGVDDYLDLGYANYNFHNAVSFGLRLNLKKLDSGYHTLLSDTESGGISLFTINDIFRFQVEVGGNYHYVDFKPNIDTWYTVVGTYDGKSVKLYANGELKGTKDIVGNVTPSIKNIILGAEPNSDIIQNYSNVTISDAFVYTDALTEEEIKNYFNGEINYYPKDNVLISFNGFKETTDMEEFYQKALNGVKIMDYDIEANFKWVPRFQYDTNLKFIKGIEKTEKTHAAFTYNNKELLGYYVTDNNDVKINNIENISDYHAITSNELDGVRKLNPSDNVEYKQALAIFQE